MHINGTEVEGFVATDTDITIILPKPWHKDWSLQEINFQLLGIGTLS